MFKIPQHVIMGSLICAVCGLLAIKSLWFVLQTRKGNWLSSQFGTDRAVLIVRGLALAGIILGTLLVLEIVRPIQW